MERRGDAFKIDNYPWIVRKFDKFYSGSKANIDRKKKAIEDLVGYYGYGISLVLVFAFIIVTASVVSIVVVWQSGEYIAKDDPSCTYAICDFCVVASWKTFEEVFLKITSFAGVFVLPLFIALIPSQTTAKIDKLEGRLFSRLHDTDAVFMAINSHIMDWVGSHEYSTLSYISATPYFGLYAKGKPSEFARKFRAAIDERLERSISESSIITNINCLVWEPFSKGRSSLYGLCGILARCRSGVSIEGGPSPVNEYYDTALGNWKDFIKKFRGNLKDNVRITVSDTIPEFFLFTASRDTRERAVLAFISSDSKEFMLNGIYTEDAAWIASVKVIFAAKVNGSHEVNNLVRCDIRTDAQIARDNELLTVSCERRHGTSHAMQIQSNFFDNNNFFVNRNVFPYDRSKESTVMTKALATVKNQQAESKKVIGIDVNTGCGLTALALMEFCSEVYATEPDAKAVSNAMQNLNRARKLFRDNSKFNYLSDKEIVFYCARGLENCDTDGEVCESTQDPSSDLTSICNLRDAIKKDSEVKSVVIVYNYLFYKSYFCTHVHRFSLGDLNSQLNQASCSVKDKSKSLDAYMGSFALEQLMETLQDMLAGKKGFLLVPYDTTVQGVPYNELIMSKQYVKCIKHINEGDEAVGVAIYEMDFPEVEPSPRHEGDPA